MNVKNTDIVSVELNEDDLSPVVKVLPGLLENLPLQICMLITKRVFNHETPIDELSAEIRRQLSEYNKAHFASVLKPTKISELVSAALGYQIDGTIHVGKNVEGGIITLNVKVTRR